MPLTSPRVATSRGARNNDLLETPQLPIAGVIRAGIQVMTPQAQKIPELREIYEQGVEAGVSFKDILQRGQQHPKCPKRGERPIHWLRPVNVPYFTVRQADFPGIPGAAEKIMERAEVRKGDPEPRLYSFPIVFPSDIFDIVFREEFSEYNSSGERVHWSQMGADGTLKCVQYKTLQAEGKNARKQLFDARRPTEVRCDCDPDGCEFFGAGKCAHYGALHFWIPGIPSEGVIRLTFKSVYTKLAVYGTLTRVKDQILGRISGLHRGKPIFMITKKRLSVSRVDRAAGSVGRNDQWIVTLTTPGVDVIEALSHQGAGQARLEAPEMSDTIASPSPPAEPVEPVVDDESSRERVRELRSLLNDRRNARGWNDGEFKEWVEHNNADVSATDAMRDEARLIAMIDLMDNTAQVAGDAKEEKKRIARLFSQLDQLRIARGWEIQEFKLWVGKNNPDMMVREALEDEYRLADMITKLSAVPAAPPEPEPEPGELPL